MSNSDYTELKRDRYERKFMVTSMSRPGIEQVVRNHPAYFKEIYQERYINNIYLDTPTLRYYYHNQLGTAQREKVRIRWYGEMEGIIPRPILEIKRKNGMRGTKQSYLLKAFSMDQSLTNAKLHQIFKDSELPDDICEKLKGLRAAIVNRYKRKYFLDFTGNYRVTLDQKMSYYPVLEETIAPINMRMELGTVVELKYDASLDMDASRISNNFPFRLTKNSKYVNGIEMFFPVAL